MTCIVGGIVGCRAVLQRNPDTALLEHKIVILEHQPVGYDSDVWVCTLPGARESGLGNATKMISRQFLKV